MTADERDLLFNQIIVVEQPGFGRDHRLAQSHGAGDHVVGLVQNARIVRQAGQQLVGPRLRIDLMLACQNNGVAGHLVDAEQGGTQQLGIPVVTQRTARA